MDRHKVMGAVVSSDSELRDTVREVVSASPEFHLEMAVELDHDAGSIDDAGFQELAAAGPTLILLDLGDDPASGIVLAERITALAPSVVLMACGGPIEAPVLMDAMRAGIREYLPKPVRAQDLEEALRRALGASPPSSEERPGKLITFFSAKGGTGTTTVATNVGVHIHAATGGRTLLVDLDTELGEIAAFLGIQARFHFVDLVKNFHRMDGDLLESYIESHASGVHVLSAPFQPRPGVQLSGDLATAILDFLRSHYEYVVVDASNSLNSAALAALRCADEVALVANLDIPSIRNLKRSFEALREGILEDPERVRVVVNRYNPRSLISIGDLEDALDATVYKTLSNDFDSVIEAVSTGRPLVAYSNSRYSDELKELAAMLAGLPKGDGARRRPLLQSLAAPFKAALNGRAHRDDEVLQDA